MRFAREWGFARQELVKEDTSGVDVRGTGNSLALSLLRAHVDRRPEHPMRSHRCCCGRRSEMCDSEVCELYSSRVRHQYVLRLDVTVHDPALVSDVQCGQYVSDDLRRACWLDPATALQERVEACALDQLCDNEDTDVTVITDVVDLNDPGACQRGGGPRFPFEAFRPGGIIGPPGLNHFHRDGAPQPKVVTSIHHSKGALPEHTVESVAFGDESTGEVRCAKAHPSGILTERPTVDGAIGANLPHTACSIRRVKRARGGGVRSMN